jgi:hypothetical protein
MNYTLQHIADLANDFAEMMGGNYRGSPETRDLAAQVDWAMKSIAMYCEPYKAGIQFSPVANKSDYRLDDLRYFERLIIRPEQVCYAGVRLRGGDSEFGLYNHNEAVRYHPLYRTGSFNRTLPVYSGANLLEIFPTPSADDVATGGHSIDGVVIPGWILSDGTYWPGGVPFGTEHSIGGGVSSTAGTATMAAGTAAILNDGSTLWANANNIKVDDTAVATRTLTGPEFDEYDFLTASNFGFTIPTGATSVTINVESLQLASTDGGQVSLEFVADVTDPDSPALLTQTVAVESGTALAEFGPLEVTAAIPLATINSSTFGVRMTGLFYFGNGLTADISVDYISLTATWAIVSASPPTTEGSSGPGGTTRETTDWLAVPDLPVYMHEALAVLTAYKASAPVPTLNGAVQAIERLLPDALIAMDQYAKECARPVVQLTGGYSRFRRRV